MDDPERILDAYIHDYLVKRRYSATSRIFQAEAAVPCNSTVIDAPGGFLYEWWSVFWDIFIARYKLQVPGVLPNNETQVAHEQEISQQRHQHSLESLRNVQMNEYLLQGKIQQQHQQLLGQQRRKEIEMDHRAHDFCSRQPDIMTIDTNKALTMNSLAGHSRNIRNSTSAGISYLHPSINEGITTTPLEGLPLNVRDHFPHRLQQQQQQQLASLLQFPRAMNQYQSQQNYMLQAQQKSLLSTVNSEGRQVGMVLNEQVTGITNDGKLFSAGEVVPSEGSDLQEGYPLSASGDGDVLTKQTQHNNEHRQQNRQGANRKKSQNSDCTLYKQDKEVFGGSSTMIDDSLSNSSQRNDQASKSKTGQKRKISSSGHARKAVTTSTAGPSPSPLPASSHRIADSPRFSRSSYLLGNYGGGKHASDELSTPLDCFARGQSLEVNDTNMISNSADHQVDTGGGGSTFTEIGLISAACQVSYCNLSSDGKLLVTGGYDKKVGDAFSQRLCETANVWSTALGELRGVLEEHSDEISDACFSPQGPCIATSSFDKTVKVWDVEKPGYSLQTFCGHSAPVTSIDYHPNNGDLLCSCDSVNEIRYWSVKNGECDRVLKGGGTKARFQPNLGRYIASVGSGISLLDVETTQVVSNQFEGHALNIQSVCWDFSGEFLASISEDRIRVWKIGSGAQPDCIHELGFSSKQFRCCVFHPHYRSLLVIGCSQSLDLWNMVENRLMTPVAEPVCALAVSETSGLVASASWDNGVKMWKWI